MTFKSKQESFEGIIHADLDPSKRRLLLMDQRRMVYLIDWSSGESIALSKFEVPEPFLNAIHSRTSLSNINILDMRLGAKHAAILTNEGFWVCELDSEAQWVRVAGHPNDPPEGLTRNNAKARGFRGPIDIGRDGKTLRRGMSSPVKLSPDGTMVLGAPNTKGIIKMDYDLELKSVSREDQKPKTWPVKLKSGIEAMALSGDGSMVAFSEGRDFRILKEGQKRASQFLHNKMYVRHLELSADGRFAASSGHYPDDFRSDPPRTVVWDVASREVLSIKERAKALGFLGSGDDTTLVLAMYESHARSKQVVWTPTSIEISSPGKTKAIASFQGEYVRSVRGDSRFLVFLTREKTAEVRVIPSSSELEPKAEEARPENLASAINQTPGSAANIFLYYVAQLKQSPGGFMTRLYWLDAADCIISYAVLGEVHAASVLFETLQPQLVQSLNEYQSQHPDKKYTLGLLTFAQLAASGLAPSADLSLDELKKGLLKLQPDTPREALRLAWAAMSVKEHTWAAKILSFNPETAHRRGDFGTNEEKIFAHLFRASKGGDGDAEGAWRALLRSFPVKLKQDWSSWPELLWAAQVMHMQINGKPADTLMAWLHEEAHKS